MAGAERVPRTRQRAQQLISHVGYAGWRPSSSAAERLRWRYIVAWLTPRVLAIACIGRLSVGVNLAAA